MTYGGSRWQWPRRLFSGAVTAVAASVLFLIWYVLANVFARRAVDARQDPASANATAAAIAPSPATAETAIPAHPRPVTSAPGGKTPLPVSSVEVRPRAPRVKASAVPPVPPPASSDIMRDPGM